MEWDCCCSPGNFARSLRFKGTRKKKDYGHDFLVVDCVLSRAFPVEAGRTVADVAWK